LNGNNLIEQNRLSIDSKNDIMSENEETASPPAYDAAKDVSMENLLVDPLDQTTMREDMTVHNSPSPRLSLDNITDEHRKYGSYPNNEEDREDQDSTHISSSITQRYPVRK
jgi:hypothetical protein